MKANYRKPREQEDMSANSMRRINEYYTEKLEDEATMYGQPAPFIFVCPVKPGQTVYQPNAEDGAIYECEVEYIIFVDGVWIASCTNILGFDADAWGESIFQTREAADKKMEGKA